MLGAVNVCPDLTPACFAACAAILGLGLCSGRAQPVNDIFAFRTVVAGTNVNATGSSVGATTETGEPYHAGKPGGASLWWSWTAPADGSITVRTAGSSIDTLLGIYAGSLVSSLTELGSNDDEDFAAGLTNSKVVIDVSSNQTCQIAVDGFMGASGTVKLSIQFGPPQPPPPAPPWALPDPYGAMVYSTNFAGQVVILNFWATWCLDCRLEIPELVALQEKYRADGLVVVGANTGGFGDTPAAVQYFLQTFAPAINYQVVMASLTMMQDYGVFNTIPITFVIDRQNLIRKKYSELQTADTLEKQIIPLLYDSSVLASRLNGSQLLLSWPTQAQSFTLEATTNLAGTNWTLWPTPPTVFDGTNTVSVSAEGSPRYFRLHLSY